MLAKTCGAIGRVVASMALGMLAGLLWAGLALLAEIGVAVVAGPGAGLLLLLTFAIAAFLVTSSTRALRWAHVARVDRVLALRWAIRYGCSAPMVAYVVFISVPGFHSADMLFLCVLPLGAAIGVTFGASGGAVEGWLATRRVLNGRVEEPGFQIEE